MIYEKAKLVAHIAFNHILMITNPSLDIFLFWIVVLWVEDFLNKKLQ